MRLRQIAIGIASVVVLFFAFQNCSGKFGSTNLAETLEILPIQNVYATAIFSSAGTACDALKAKLNTGGDASDDLQACIDAVPANQTLNLPPGIASIRKTIYVRKPIALQTDGKKDGQLCESTDSHTCFEIRALGDTNTGGGSEGLLSMESDGVQLLSIVVNGNKTARIDSSSSTECKTNNGWGTNLHMRGKNTLVAGVVIKNGLCGTGFYVERVENSRIVGNAFIENGYHRYAADGGHFMDGMTVHMGINSEFSANAFIDNTDVDLIFGNCVSCKVNSNRFTHRTDALAGSFVALMFNRFSQKTDLDGNYTGTEVANNSIDCGPERNCGIGLYLGSEMWNTGPIHGGYFHDNTITNARNGLVVEFANGPIRLKDNMVTNSGDFLWYNGPEGGCQARGHDYNIANTTNVVVEDTKIARSSYKNFPLSRYLPMHPTSSPIAWNGSVNPAWACKEMDTRAQAGFAIVRLLKRQPTDQEFLTNSHFLRQGYSLGQLEDIIRTWPEYKTQQPTAPVTQITPVVSQPAALSGQQQLVTDLYQSVLKKQPDAAMLAAVQPMKCKAIAHMIVQSGEAYSSLYNLQSSTDFVIQVYSSLLKRNPSADDINLWKSELEGGRKSKIEILDVFLAVDEFKLRCSQLGVAYE
jgi:Domain of unknown function (DUF4214)